MGDHLPVLVAGLSVDKNSVRGCRGDVSVGGAWLVLLLVDGANVVVVEVLEAAELEVVVVVGRITGAEVVVAFTRVRARAVASGTSSSSSSRAVPLDESERRRRLPNEWTPLKQRICTNTKHESA